MSKWKCIEARETGDHNYYDNTAVLAIVDNGEMRLAITTGREREGSPATWQDGLAIKLAAGTTIADLDRWTDYPPITSSDLVGMAGSDAICCWHGNIIAAIARQCGL